MAQLCRYLVGYGKRDNIQFICLAKCLVTYIRLSPYVYVGTISVPLDPIDTYKEQHG